LAVPRCQPLPPGEGLKGVWGTERTPFLLAQPENHREAIPNPALSVDAESTESAGTAHLTHWENNIFLKNSTVKPGVSEKFNGNFHFFTVFTVYFIPI
jgi:hypothetical protein